MNESVGLILNKAPSLRELATAKPLTEGVGSMLSCLAFGVRRENLISLLRRQRLRFASVGASQLR